jgi:hypothetical protein
MGQRKELLKARARKNELNSARKLSPAQYRCTSAMLLWPLTGTKTNGPCLLCRPLAHI